MRTSIVAFLVLSSYAGAVYAQIERKPQDPRTLALPPGVMAQHAPDLVAEPLGFSPNGEIRVTLKNLGAQPINPVTFKNTAPAGPPIRVDVYIGGTLLQTLYQPSLGGKADKVFTVALASNVPKCKESRALRAIVDPQNVIQEQRDDNNTTDVTAARPCPDLAVKSIKRDSQGGGTSYIPKVTIVNRGNAPSPSTQVWGTALSSYPGITGWPELSPTHTIPALQPGQDTSFHIGGNVLSFDSSWVRIILDRYFEIQESDESNNFVEKEL
ncbi:MAG: CARDB domain-containing protein [Steroidobacteraceae bacterium]